MQSIDPYPILEAILKDLWKCYQDNINKCPEAAEDAKNMWETLNGCLESIRISKIRENTLKYEALCRNLKTMTSQIQDDIEAINKIVETYKKVAEYAKILDSIIDLAAKIAAA